MAGSERRDEARSRRGPGRVPGAAALRSWAPDLAIGVATFLAVALLPLFLGGYVHERTWAQYALFAREIVGQAGVVPLETPKPLSVLRAALGEVGFLWSGALLFALAPACLGRLTKRLHGTRVVGAGAVLLLLVGNRYFLPEAVLSGYWPLPYLGLISLAVWAFADRRYGVAMAAVGVAGLVRPDAWGYALFLLAVIRLTDREAWRPAYAAALAAVPAWMLFDLLLAGTPFHSLGTTDRYQALVGAGTVDPSSYWPYLFADVAEAFPALVLVAGVVGLALATVGRREPETLRLHGVLAGLAVLPLLGYWALSGVGDGYIFHVRFLVLPLLLLPLYALALPLELLRLGSGAREPAPLLEEGLALAALVLAIGLGSSTFEPWERTKELHARGRMHREVRGEVLAWLREHWVGTEGGLVTGNSLELFAHRLGPEAARRMLRLREVATWPDRLGSDPAGVLVAISQDTSGHGLRFRFLERGEAVGVPEWGVRFEPRATLRHAGRTVGMIFDYRPLGGG